jgi:translation initiation factor 2 alpha subunit (eIF-2alpha)
MTKDKKTQPPKDETEKPNTNIKPPEYMVVTEGFDPSKVKEIVKKVMEMENKSD